MSLAGKYFEGWRFRTTNPSLSPGDEVDVFVNRHEVREVRGTSDDERSTAANEGVGVARIGDTLLYVEGTEPDHVGLRVRARVTEFDGSSSTGRAEYVETVGTSSYVE